MSGDALALCMERSNVGRTAPRMLPGLEEAARPRGRWPRSVVVVVRAGGFGAAIPILYGAWTLCLVGLGVSLLV
jgi:hypothetical protein